MANNLRSIFPTMCRLFNNSHLTQSVANSIVEKLNEVEFRDFCEWLKYLESNQIANKHNFAESHGNFLS